jgi:hypothetical protein
VLSGQDGLTVQPGRLELYVSEADAEDLIHQYRMREDRDGQVRLVIVPSGIPPELIPGGGDPVAAPAAVSDLLEEDDPRARYAAAVQLHSYQDALRAAGWLDNIDSVSPQPHKSHGKSQLVAKTEQAQSG